MEQTFPYNHFVFPIMFSTYIHFVFPITFPNEGKDRISFLFHSSSFLFFLSFQIDCNRNDFFFLWESFNLRRPLLIIAFYHKIKTLISFLYEQGLNSKSPIQPSETLPVELTGTH